MIQHEIHILCTQRKRELAARLWSLALVPAGFAAFVVANGGVVVGDRANHAPAAHWAQPLYTLLFTAAAFAPMHLHPRRCNWLFIILVCNTSFL